MAVGLRMKTSLKSELRVSAGRMKETGDGPKPVDRRKRGSRECAKGRGVRYETDDIRSDSEPRGRKEHLNWRAKSGVKERKFGLDREQSSRGSDKKRNVDLEREKKRTDDTRRVGKERKFLGERGEPKIKSLSMEDRYSRIAFAAAKKGRTSNVGLSGSKSGNWKRREFDGVDSGIQERTRPASALRGYRGKKDEPSDWRCRDFYGNSHEERRSKGATCAVRSHRGKEDDGRNGKVSYRSEARSGSVEASADNLRLKGRNMDGFISKGEHKGSSGDELLDKNAKSKDDSNEIAEQKHVRRQTRLLDKSGKKIRIQHKPSEDGSVVTDASPKKRKRVMKLDPYDISNKRLDDGASSTSSTEKDVAEDTEASRNAQFRAIQPSPSILEFVEDNLLGRRRLLELKNSGYNIKLSAPLDNIPFSTSTERERIEENVFRNKLEFFAAAKISSSFPPPIIPEIAFAGRSNVGKSSLLNALTRQWGVVRTSDKPGHTQSINFFKLASKLCLVDLPGYGFAYAKEEVKDAWEELVKEYVSTRVDLQRVCLLIDTKWGMKPRDHELVDLMERSQTPYQIVLTKTDVVFPIDVARRAMQIQENLKSNKSIVNPVMMVSSKSGAGIRSLRTVLSKITRFVKL